MSDENPQSEIDEAEHEADEDLGKMEDDAAEMEDRLEEHESRSEDVEVPEPDQGDDLSISTPEDKEAAGVGGDDVPEDQGEAADEAGQ